MAIAFTDVFIKNLTLTGRHTDSSTKGLNIQVKPNGGKYWTFRYLLQGKRTDLSLGTYPSVGLKAARARATDARAQLNRGEQAKAGWKAQSAVTEKQVESSKVLFKDYAVECIAAKRSEWRNSKHAEQWLSTIVMYANPVIGDKPISEVDMDDILEILNPIWHSKTVTATRLRGRLEWVLASATVRKLRTGVNPAAWKGLLETILPKPGKIKEERHHPALSYLHLPAFVRQLHEMDGVAALALEFLVLNANRTGEVIGARRDEVSETGMWTIPGHRMKIGKEHRVPLGGRSIELLQIARSLDPDSEYLFSNRRKPLSNMAMSMLLRRMGHEVTVHGFRSCFRDWVAEETSHSSEVAEKALAHAIANKVEAAYRRGDLLEARRRLMTDWESYCTTGRWSNKTMQYEAEAAQYV